MWAKAGAVLAGLLCLCLTFVALVQSMAIYVRSTLHTPTPLDNHIVLVYTPLRHQAILRILKHFHAFCVDNSVPYWICGGTLLGQQRCGGIIPFDDDADVAVPVEYIAFVKENFAKQYCGRFRIANCPFALPECTIWDDAVPQPVFVDIFGVKMDDSISAYRFTQRARQVFKKQVFFPSEVFPLRTVAFHDISVQCMSKPRDYLARTYGSRWNDELVVYLGHTWSNWIIQLVALQFGRQTVDITSELRDIMNALAASTTCLGDQEGGAVDGFGEAQDSGAEEDSDGGSDALVSAAAPAGLSAVSSALRS